MNLAASLDVAQRAGQERVADEIVRMAATLRLRSFIKQAWHFHHEDEPLGWNWHIDCISDHLEAVVRGDITWLLVNVPPGMAKSLICSVYFPAWLWLSKPWYKFLCSSTNDYVTLRDARRQKKLVASPWYQRVFRPGWQLSKGQAADGNFGNTRNGERVSRTVRSSIIGARPHLKILDDANDPDKGAEECDKVNQWIENTYLKRRTGPRGKVVGIQQRTRENDATGYMMARELNPSLVNLVLPNRYDKKRAFLSTVLDPRTGKPWVDPRTETDELLFPLILDQATTDQERAAPGGEAVDAAQNQQDPTPAGGMIFRRGHFNRWAHEPNIDEWRRKVQIPDYENKVYPTHPLPDPFDFVIIVCDPNNLKDEKATRGTDYAVFDVWGKHGRNYYLIFQVRQKLSVAGTIAAIHQAVKLYAEHLAVVLVESKANGPQIINGLRAIMGIAAEEQNPEKFQFVRKWNVQGETKTQRAKGIAYVPESGRVFIPCELEQDYFRHWMREVTGFPHRTRDDCVDTLTMALTFLERDRQFG